MLWLIYITYLLLREMVEEPQRRGVFAAVFGIVGFVDVPIVFMSIRWWRTLHPAVAGGEGFNMEATMLPALFLSLAAFTTLFFYMLLLRIGLGDSQRRLAELRERARWMQEGEIGMGGLEYVALAYGIIWLGLFAYLFRLSLRAESLRRELELLKEMLQTDPMAPEGQDETVVPAGWDRPQAGPQPGSRL